jgi:hypothetical protein
MLYYLLVFGFIEQRLLAELNDTNEYRIRMLAIEKVFLLTYFWFQLLLLVRFKKGFLT